jgi:hypothetical protein
MTTKKLPDNFSPAKHLNDVLRKEQNERVKEWFKDIEWDENTDGDIETPRTSLRTACTIRPDDSSILIQLRLTLFYEILGFGKRDLAIVHGVIDNSAPEVANHPMLNLVFSQDEAATPDGLKPVRKEKSVRLMKFNATSEGSLPPITKANMEEIAREIKTQFIEGTKGRTYTCGAKTASYVDPVNGFATGNYLLVSQDSEAEDVYRRICNVIDAPFDINKLDIKTPKKQSQSAPSTETITVMGKTMKKARWRPTANVRFRQAYITLGSIVNPVYLIDLTGTRKPLIDVFR